jgi:MFS family permease
MDERAPIPASHVVAVTVGNGLEFYDFLCYALFSVDIGHAFFPAHSNSASLLLSLLAFWLGFMTRPIGAMVLGPLGDRIGRKPVMLISFTMIGIAMLGIALTPSYSQIGIAAPILALTFRLVQGFALGAEVGPSTAYLIEAAPPGRRGFYGAMQFASQDSAIMVASIVGMVLSTTLAPHDLHAWGWRAAFLLGVAIVPFGVLIRRRLPETLHAADDAALAPDATTGSLSIIAAVRPHLNVIILGFLLLAGATIGVYVKDYMTTYAVDTLHTSSLVAFGVSLVASVCSVSFVPIAGALSDRVGRRPVLIAFSGLLFVLIIPAFWMIVHFQSTLMLYAMIALVSIPFAFLAPPMLVMLTEVLPVRVRSGAVATIYAFAISIFGGSTQFVVKSLITLTSNPLAPAFYWTLATALCFIAALFIPETAPRILARKS